MASNLDHVMTFNEACEMFTNEILPTIVQYFEQDGIPDIPARCEAWNNWTDELAADELISDWQVNNWGHPPCNDDNQPRSYGWTGKPWPINY